MKDKKYYSRWIIVLSVLLLLMVAGVLAMAFYYNDNTPMNDNKFVEISGTRVEYLAGIRIDGVDVGGLSEEEARAKVLSKPIPPLGTIKIKSVGEETEINLSVLVPQRNIDYAISDAFKVGNTSSRNAREEIAADIATKGGMDFESELKYDLSPLRGEVERAAQALSVAPVDASLHVREIDSAESINYEAPDVDTNETSGEGVGNEYEELQAESEQSGEYLLNIKDLLRFEESVPGQEVDVNELYSLVQKYIDEEKLDEVIEIMPIPIPAEVEVEDIQDDFMLISTTTTTFSKGAHSNPNRVDNLEKAAGILNGHVIQPGEEFSCNEVFGPRTEATGWRAAGAISNGKSVQEPGGGICQISSTLFNTVLKADLEIVNRSPHSWAQSYLPSGQDAAISTGGPDFVFKNNTDSPVVLAAKADRSTKDLVIQMYGKPLLGGIEIRMVSEQTGTISQPKTQTTTDKEAVRNGRSGSTYNTFKETYVDGELIDREFAYDTRYRALSSLVLAGGGGSAPAAKAENDLPNENQSTPAPKPAPTPKPAPVEEQIPDEDIDIPIEEI